MLIDNCFMASSEALGHAQLASRQDTLGQFHLVTLSKQSQMNTETFS